MSVYLKYKVCVSRALPSTHCMFDPHLVLETLHTENGTAVVARWLSCSPQANWVPANCGVFMLFWNLRWFISTIKKHIST